MPTLAASLGAESDHFIEVAQAILTTDTVEKTAFARLEVAGTDGAPLEIRIAALCKGSGMIHPQLVPHATMLVYILTDATIEPAVLSTYLNPAIEVSFNRISVDGDTSTNDTVLLLASGASGVAIGPGNAAFAAALTQVCTSLARQIVADGEGVTHVVELRIEGAASDSDALRVAKAIAHSPLVKTAWPAAIPTGPPGCGDRLFRRASRSRAHRYMVRRTPHLPRRRARRRVRRGHRPRLHLPDRVRHLHPSQPGRGLVRILDHRPDHTIHPHQRRLFDLGGALSKLQSIRSQRFLQLMKTTRKHSSTPVEAPPHNGFSLISNEKLLQLYTTMLKCRMIEQRISTLAKQNTSIETLMAANEEAVATA